MSFWEKRGGNTDFEKLRSLSYIDFLFTSTTKNEHFNPLFQFYRRLCRNGENIK